MKKYILLLVVGVFILLCNSRATLGQSDRRSGISLVVQGQEGVDFAEEYLYHDIAMDDQKIVYVKSTIPVTFMHNERNIFACEFKSVPSGSVYYGWSGLDGVANSGDENIIGNAGKDGIVNSGDEGDIYFRVDRFEQGFSYEKVFNPATDPAKNQYINIPYTNPFSFDELLYETGIAVVGTTGSNNGPYGYRPQSTSERYQRGSLSPFGEEVHVLTYWDNDMRILPGLASRGNLSDGNMVFFIVNPKVPAIRLSAFAGEEFYTTALTSFHTPRILEQTTYLTRGVSIELLNMANTHSMFYKIDGGTAIRYTSPFTLTGLSDGEHLLEFWIDGGSVKRRALVVNPDYPSKDETHGALLWDNEEEQSYIRNRLLREPYKSGYYNFKRNLTEGYPKIKIPIPTRKEWRGIIWLAYVPFHYMLPYYMEQNYSIQNNPDYALLAKRALISLMNVDFIGSELNNDNFRPSTDIYSIPNSGHNAYVSLGLGYDLAIHKFKRTEHPQGISPIEDYKIRDQLAKVAHIMLKYKENKATKGNAWSGWDGQVAGDMHWAHGEELVAYVIGAAMPAYETPLYGTSGFNGKKAKYLWTPYPEQRLTWFEILTDPNISTPGHPNARSAARYNYIFSTYEQLLQYPRDPTALWDFPQEGIFWQAANGFAGATRLYNLGEIDPAQLTSGQMIKVPEGDLDKYGSLTDVWTLEGRKLQTAWNRSFNLSAVAGANGGMFAVEWGGYESPFGANAALVYQIHKRKFGTKISPKMTGYFETKFKRIVGDFDSRYLKAMATSSVVYTYQDGQYNYPLLNNSQWLSVAMPLMMYNPHMPLPAKDALGVLKSLAQQYSSVYYRKFYEGPLAFILFEDDEAKYNSQTIVLYGDVSGDGEISAYDAALAAHIAVDLEHPDIKNRAAAEISGDGEVSAYDAALIAQKAVGLIEKFPVEE